MSYQQFLNNTTIVISKVLNLVSQIYGNLMSNHIFKTIVYFIIFAFIIDFIFIIINLIKKMFNNKKQKYENKEVE